MLQQSLIDQLAGHMDKIVEPIELVASLDGSERSEQLRELLEEIAALSDDVSVGLEDGDRTPSFTIRRAADHDAAVTFGGLPLGHEFTSLVLALLQVGGHPPAIDDAVADRARALDRTHHFETYFSLSCQVCPDVVQALNVLAVLNPHVTHTALDGSVFPDEVEDRQVRAVPAVFCDGEPFEQGRVTLEEILDRLDEGSADRAVAEIDAMDPFDVLIVGGGPAGASAAVYAARKGIRTALVAERFGGQVLDTLGIENLITIPYTEGPKLAAELERNVREHDVDIVTRQRAARLVPATEPGGLHRVELESGATIDAKTVVLATGARWRELSVPGEDDYKNRGVAFCPHCDGPLYKGKKVAVVGGGNSGVEAAIDLAGLADEVTLIEFDAELRADDVLQRALDELDNTNVIVSCQTTEIVGDGDTVTGLRHRDCDTGEEGSIDLDGVFVQIGLLPNTEWLEGAVELSDRGEIVIDERGATSVPGVFAAGEGTTVPFKQIGVALGAGSTAALSAFDHLIREPTPTLATACARRRRTRHRQNRSPVGIGVSDGWPQFPIPLAAMATSSTSICAPT